MSLSITLRGFMTPQLVGGSKTHPTLADEAKAAQEPGATSVTNCSFPLGCLSRTGSGACVGPDECTQHTAQEVGQ